MKIAKCMAICLALGLFGGSAYAASTVTNAGVGISAYLPDNWIAVTEGDTAMTLSDTTFTYKSQITCRKHAINAADYPAAGSWTRSHFIAYLLVVQYSYDPFGAVLYFDSSAACKQDSLFWAPEAFTEFYTLDTVLGAWNEYMQYTESGTNGYEIYAIGDTADMKLNIGMYMAMIRMITIDNKSDPVNVAIPARNTHRATFTVANPAVSPVAFDLLGKKRSVKSGLFNGIYCRPGVGKIGLEIK